MQQQTAVVTFTIDGKEIKGQAGQTIIEAADQAGVYIPRLCHMPGLEPYGSCRVCTVLVNGRPCSACTQPVTDGMDVDNSTDDLKEYRKNIIEMLFVEGNHFCMFCEKSGNCELQALAYKFGITAPEFPYLFPERNVDASHTGILIDHNRCILCARCVRASRDIDGKHVFQFTGRGTKKKISVNSDTNLADTTADVTDQVLNVCPVGALLKKHSGYTVPVGKRLYDTVPIGTDIENQSATSIL